uniref:Uncharacterized protein n=1 Tax=Eutreptiella gymnastica TaxID=73025 RepID=A0A7S4G517_9EUGL
MHVCKQLNEGVDGHGSELDKSGKLSKQCPPDQWSTDASFLFSRYTPHSENMCTQQGRQYQMQKSEEPYTGICCEGGSLPPQPTLCMSNGRCPHPNFCQPHF